MSVDGRLCFNTTGLSSFKVESVGRVTLCISSKEHNLGHKTARTLLLCAGACLLTFRLWSCEPDLRVLQTREQNAVAWHSGDHGLQSSM